MEIQATAKHIRISPRKVRLVVNLIKGKNISDAQAQLFFSKKNAAKPVLKVLKSAVANALHNYHIDQGNLFVKAADVQDGVTLKRWMPRAFGRATPIMKRSCHIRIILGVLDAAKIGKAKKKKISKTGEEETNAILDKGERVDLEKKERIEKENTESHSPEIFDVRMASKRRHQQHDDKRELKSRDGFKKKIFNRKTEG